MYDYRCEYCEGTVRPKKVKREAFKHKNGFVILEDVTIGVCDVCGRVDDGSRVNRHRTRYDEAPCFALSTSVHTS